MVLNEDIIDFFHNQSFVITVTIDRKGMSHCSCKGLIQINEAGEIHLLDLYKGRTYRNLKLNPNISITAIDEHKFKGYCLKGQAKIMDSKNIDDPMLIKWEHRITNRITARLIKNVKGERGHNKHPEVLLPEPKYMIVIKVKQVVDLTPRHINI